jgi:hypothetical protein
MAKTFTTFGTSDEEQRRDELIRTIEHSVEKLRLPELEALYYDMVSKDYIRKG